MTTPNEHDPDSVDLEDGLADIDPAGDPDDVDDLEDGTP